MTILSAGHSHGAAGKAGGESLPSTESIFHSHLTIGLISDALFSVETTFRPWQTTRWTRAPVCERFPGFLTKFHQYSLKSIPIQDKKNHRHVGLKRQEFILSPAELSIDLQDSRLLFSSNSSNVSKSVNIEVTGIEGVSVTATLNQVLCFCVYFSIVASSREAL
jgi:hypothetical protein